MRRTFPAAQGFPDAGTAPHGGTTRVGIEHTGWQWLGSRGGAWRDRNQHGWLRLLTHDAAAV
jgi:hypothetical protein